MKIEVLVHGYLIADRDGLAQRHTFASNRADCWRLLLSGCGYQPSEWNKYRRYFKRQGFQAVAVYAKSY